MTQGPPTMNASVARLGRRGVVAVGGADAEKFLNDLATADVSAAGKERAVYAGLLTPQGKILFDFIVFRDGEGFWLDIPRDRVADFVKRLAFYRLRSKVTIDDRSAERQVIAGWNAAPGPVGISAPDPRLAALGWRAILTGDVPMNATEAEYDAHRIFLGVPEGGLDFHYGDAFPHDADMDQLGGVDFAKGCYVGQEVVSRMQHRHTARRRVVSVAGTGPLPAPGTEILAAGRPIGTLASSSNGIGLALVRLDRAKEAMDKAEPIDAAGVALTLTIPSWAEFGWPEPAAREA
jgi:folate-binding protein YgfZ